MVRMALKGLVLPMPALWTPTECRCRHQVPHARFFTASLVQRSVPFTRMSNTRNGEGLKPSKYFLQYLLKQKAGISNTIYDVCVND